MKNTLLDYEKEHIIRLRRLLPECTVLLKKNGDFPLKEEEIGDLALYGNGARRTIKGGTGSGEVNSRYFRTCEKALEKAGFNITTKEWLSCYDRIIEKKNEEFIESVRKEARENHVSAAMFSMGAIMPEPNYDIPLDGKGDVAIYVLSRISGEGTDRKDIEGDIRLTVTEIRTIKKLNEKYKKFILVLNVGGPIDLSPVLDYAENILLLSQLGIDTGRALSKIITGKAYPSGKLSTTWTRYEDYPGIGTFGERDDSSYSEGIYVGYRYFDSEGKEPIFPFGYGLSFTEFKIKAKDVVVDKDIINIRADVKNKGDFKGKEVVQLYVTSPEKGIDKPYQTLSSFVKTGELSPDGEEEVNLSFSIRDLAVFDERDASFKLYEGDYILRLGNSSRNTKVIGKIRLDKDVIVKKVKNLLGGSGLVSYKPKKTRNEEIPKNTKVYKINADDIKTEEVIYKNPLDIEKIHPDVVSLSDEELSYLSVGEFDNNAISSIIGNASKTVLGAAGETTGKLKDKGIRPLVMADGPAGIRISRDCFKDGKGIHAIGPAIPKSVLSLLSPAEKSVISLLEAKPGNDATVYHQYCTAIPIGTAIAQSFNTELARECGDIVGDEMERFNIDLWLAPALNIHRNIRCGRNFEYYSEDPLISGLFAAAITKGVESHKGKKVTIKHFAANNQETNRYNNNSIVSERAMREIYLKGFEICIREADPSALMTSYNLLNGIHTSERKDLLYDVLRTEFGFKGIVMTDWIIGTVDKSSIYNEPSPSKSVDAGNDIIMPGSRKMYNDILNALKNKKISRTQVMINVSRIYSLIEELSR